MGIFKHAWIWGVIILLLSLLNIPFFNNYAMKQVQAEQEYVASLFGYQTGVKIRARTDKFYEANLLKWQMRTRSMAMSDRESFSFKVYQSVWSSVYQSIFRFFVAMEFGLYLLPIIVAALIDGLSMRKVKTENLGWFSPVKYHGSLHGVVALLGLALAYLTLPFAVPPHLVVIWYIALGVLISVAARNLQRML